MNFLLVLFLWFFILALEITVLFIKYSIQPNEIKNERRWKDNMNLTTELITSSTLFSSIFILLFFWETFSFTLKQQMMKHTVETREDHGYQARYFWSQKLVDQLGEYGPSRISYHIFFSVSLKIGTGYITGQLGEFRVKNAYWIVKNA